MSNDGNVAPVGAHLIGGIMAPDAEAAMRTAAGILGRYLESIPDGETGDRSRWVGWQRGRLEAVPGISPVDDEDPDRFRPFTPLKVDESLTEVPAGAIGYADAAIESYEVFKRLREEGIIPEGVRFLVAIPTAYATIVTWIRIEDQMRFLPIYTAALVDEIRQMGEAIGDDLLLQYDVSAELAVLTAGLPAGGNLAQERVLIKELGNALSRTPKGVDYGLHFCYGDREHRHFTVPDDLGLCVKIAKAVGAGASFMHFPADRETGVKPAYFEPLRELDTPALSLGVVDYEGDPERTQALVDAAVAGTGGMKFSISTECGLARIDERGADGPSVEELLEAHARFAEPLPGR